MIRVILCVGFAALMAPSILQADVTLVDDGQPKGVIVADAAVMAADKPVAGLKFLEAEAEHQRQRLRESVNDLALYLYKMSGTKIEIVTQLPGLADTRVRLLVGGPAVLAFGQTTKTALYKQGFRYVVTP